VVDIHLTPTYLRFRLCGMTLSPMRIGYDAATVGSISAMTRIVEENR
jgi:hypothetical protein